MKCRRRPLSGWLPVAGLVVGLFAGVADVTACEVNPEQAVISALMNVDTDRAITQSRSLDVKHALIPSSEFYVALSTWYRAYQDGNAAEKSTAIDALRRALSVLELSARTSPTLDNVLAAGLAGGHIARILFDNEQYLPAYRIAQRTRKRIREFLAEAEPGHTGWADAQLLEGLFELYSYDLRRRASWLPGTFSYQGSRDRGISLVEQAISGGAVFRDDAIRALLGEVPWRTPDFCRYVDLINQTGERLPDNRDVAILRQGLMLKCGYPTRALKANEAYLARHQQDSGWEFLARARWRILASLGDVDAIESISPVTSDLGHYRLALANAYDIDNRRPAALQIYQTLKTSNEVNAAVRAVAAVRIKYPFRAPDKVHVAQFEPGFKDRCN